jgi:hypothetical protein
LRYGRSRNTATAGKGINPATMYLLDEFIAVGTHVRTDRYIFADRHGKRPCKEPGDTGHQNGVGRGCRAGNTDDEGRNGYDAVVSTEDRRTEPIYV